MVSIRQKLKNLIDNTMIFIVNLLPLNKRNKVNSIRIFHFIFPLLFIIPLCYVNTYYFKYIYVLIVFVLITQISFDTCIITDLEEHFTDDIENMQTVSESSLIILGLEPNKTNTRILTGLVTSYMLFCAYAISDYRFNYSKN
jgi:hypothetical protein